MALGELHKLIDVPRGVKTAGTRNYYLTGAGVALHRAVQQLAVDLLTERGFQLLDVPLMVRAEAMRSTGFFPLGLDQTYRITGEDQWLVGTSEVPLVSYYSGEIVDVTDPIRLAAVSVCFRNEVGSAGRDVHGLYRVHQFAKVEQVIICEASLDASEQMFQEITRNAEDLLQLLELPYRKMAVCTGDMAQKPTSRWTLRHGCLAVKLTARHIRRRNCLIFRRVVPTSATVMRTASCDIVTRSTTQRLLRPGF